MNINAQTKPNPWLHRFAVLTAVVTFLLIGLGGLVTSHEAGMSVPDWPTSYGYNMFALPIKFWTGGAFFEHTHRLLASAVGVLTTILVLWLFGKKSRPFMRWAGFILPIIGIANELLFPNHPLDGVLYGATGLVFYTASFFWPRYESGPKWLCWLGVVAFLLVVAQGILGGLRVVLSDAVLGIFHGIVGQSFFVLVCAIALFTSRFWQVAQASRLRSGEKFAGGTPALRSLRSHVLFVTILIFAQLLVGATMRHQHAGLAISDFPLAHGKIWPDTSADAVARYNAERMETTNVNPITAFQIILQMVHRIVAFLILAGVAAAAGLAVKRLGGKDSLTKLAFFWLALIIFQVALGVATLWTNKAADVATAHVMVGALSLVTGALWCLIAFGRSAKMSEAETAPFGAFGTFATNKP